MYVLLIGDDTMYARAQPVVEALRRERVRVALDPGDRKLDKQLKTAQKLGVSHVLSIGENELQSGRFQLKNLVRGDSEEHSLERIVSVLQDKRRLHVNRLRSTKQPGATPGDDPDFDS